MREEALLAQCVMKKGLLMGESGGPQPPPWLKTSLAGPSGADTDSQRHSTAAGA